MSHPASPVKIPTDRPLRVASLTTLPSRLPFIEETLKSLVQQTVPFDEIVLALPRVSARENATYELPSADFLSQFGDQVTILESDTDWGPATKLIPIVQRELRFGRNDTTIVVVDDDQVYPREMLETYQQFQTGFPGSALTLRGWKMPHNLHWRAMHVWHSYQIRESHPVAVVTGIGSFCVRPRFFSSELWNYESAPAGAYFMDDVWISGNLARNAVPRVLLGGVPHTLKNQNSKSMPRNRTTLSDIPMARAEANDETIQYFREHWTVFEDE